MKIKNLYPKRVLFPKGIILGLLVLTALLNGVSGWETVSIDYGSTNLYTRNSLEIKSNGDPCFVFVNNDSELFYECWNGAGFYDGESIKNITGYKDFGLALDNTDKPHICLVDSTNILSYYELRDSILNESNLTTTGTPTSCSIDVDKNNKPHIVYSSSEAGSIGHYEIFLLGDTWTTSLVRGSKFPPPFSYPVIKLTTDDKKYVLGGNHHGDPSDSYVRFMNTTFESTTWTESLVEDSDNHQDIGDMALYGNRAYISYETDNGFNLSVQDNVDSTNFTFLYSPATSLSLAVYGGVPYGVYSTGGNMLLLTNSTGSFAVTTEFGSVNSTHKPTLEIDSNGDKWVLYTATGSNIVRLAYERPLYTITGNIYDYVTVETIENAYICYTADSTDYCDYSNSSGGYEIGLFADDYALLITKTGYDDYSPDGTVSISSDLPNNHYYLTPEGIAETENESSVLITFIHWETEEPIASQAMKFYYVEGCPCLIGNTYYYTTNSEGKITGTRYKGTYEISPMGDYLIYAEEDGVYTTTAFAFISENDYHKVFKLKPYTESGNQLTGYVYDAITGLPLANMTVNILSSFDFYTDITNESGFYEIYDIEGGTYTIYGYDTIAPINYDKSDDSEIVITNTTTQNIYLYPSITPGTLTLRWNISDCSDDSPLANVTTIMEDSNGLPIYYNLSGEDGVAEITGIEPGWYNITHYLTGYISQSAEYNYQHSFNLSTCLRQMGIAVCYKVNGTIYGNNTSNPLQLAEFRVKNEYGTLLTYITDETGVFDTDPDLGGRCLEEAYYTLEVIREGYNTYSELIFLSENLTNISLILNESEKRTTYIVLVADKKTYISIEGAKVNLTEEYVNVNDSINKICYHPDSSDGCVFSNLRAGHYIVEITADGYNSDKFRKYLIGNSKSIVLLDESEPHYTLRVQVMGEDESNHTRALEGAEVTLYKIIDTETSTLEIVRTEPSNSGGYVWFDSLIVDNYRVKAEKDYYFPNEKDVYLDSNKEITLIVKSSGDINPATMGAKKTQAEFKIQDFLYTNVPSLFGLFALLFLISALTKVTALAGRRY